MDKKKNTLDLVVVELFIISRQKGNGRLTRKVWVDTKGKLIKYSLAYINFNIYAGDNGRVLGYDNSHNFHHKHFFGKIAPIKFHSFEAIEKQFEIELEEIQCQSLEKSL